MRYEYQFLWALAWTVFIEVAALILIVRVLYRIDRRELSYVRLCFSGFICSFSTLPYLWFVLPQIIKSRYIFIASGEVFAILIEALIYFFLLQVILQKALIISLACNIFSLLIGTIFIT
jgi:hypothetical protein